MKKVLIFGAGPSGKRTFEANKYNWQIVAFCDNDADKWGKNIQCIPIYSPDAILSLDFDVICIASAPGREEIMQQLRDMGISKEKIQVYKSDSGCELFIKNFAEDCYEDGLPGSVAEVGVFRGDVAKFINEYFFDRALFLFDTFEGFPSGDVAIEHQFQFSAAKEKDFDNTSECIVMEKMKYKDNVVIRKGKFPKTAEGIEDRFIFVRLDVDLYQPTLEGLKFFSKRMNRRGILLIHDFYTKSYSGVRQAVTEFLASPEGHQLHRLPAGDLMSIAIVGF